MSKPGIEAVVAMDLDGAIGRDGTLPWHLPADLRHFRALTLHSTIVMGRKTYDSIGKALPRRRNIIISKSLETAPPDCEIARSVDDVLALTASEERIYIIGGASIYEAFADYATIIHATIVEARVGGNVFFPKPRARLHQTCVGRYYADEKNHASLRFEQWSVL